MPSARGRGYATVEVKPDVATSKSKSNIAPSSPGSPKAVRFAPSAKADSRALTQPEAWSLYHFEAHARQCPDCYNPLDAAREGRQLCATGHGLAQDVAEHVYRLEGIVYSRKKDNHKLVEVDIPREYTQLPQLLRSMERALRARQRTVPIISYEPTYPVSPRRTTPDSDDALEDDRKVVVEPARTESKSNRKSRHKSTRYQTVIVEDDAEPTTNRGTAPSPNERRGSLYVKDKQRERKEAYSVEIREPGRRERRRDGERERPKSGFWT